MLWNPVTVSNNSPMLPRRAKVNRSDSNGLCAGRCPHEMESYLGFGEFCTWFMSWTMRVLPSVFCSNSGIRPNVLLPMALKITILLDLLINCLPAVTTAKRSVTLSLHNLKEKNPTILLSLIKTVMGFCNRAQYCRKHFCQVAVKLNKL